MCAGGVDLPWTRSADFKGISAHWSKGKLAKRMTAFKSKLACKDTTSDSSQRIHNLSRWMINPNPKGRPTARQALNALQSPESLKVMLDTEKTSALLKSLQLNTK